MQKMGVLLRVALLAVVAAPASGEDLLAAPPGCDCEVIPALTPVSIEILAQVSSKTSKSGDTFPIRLAAPIVLNGKELVPAGAAGWGEVVHAKKSGGMGAAGELVLAARYVDVEGQRLPLRSLNLAAAGKSNIHKVDAINAGSAAAPLPIGLLGFFITGGEVAIARGTVVQAKTRACFVLPADAGGAPAAGSDIVSTGE